MNNPAAAARRTASELGEALDTLLEPSSSFVSSGVEREDAAVLVELQKQAMKQAKAGAEEDAIAAADREDALAVKIDEMGYEGWRLAEPLVAPGWTTSGWSGCGGAPARPPATPWSGWPPR